MDLAITVKAQILDFVGVPLTRFPQGFIGVAQRNLSSQLPALEMTSQNGFLHVLGLCQREAAGSVWSEGCIPPELCGITQGLTATVPPARGRLVLNSPR